jgi:hypothetical protein
MVNMKSENAPMLSRAAAHIEETFFVTPEQAVQEARGLLGLIESKGGVASWSVVSEAIERQLGARLSWRSADAKQAAERRRTETVAAYNAHLDAARPSWTKKW